MFPSCFRLVWSEAKEKAIELLFKRSKFPANETPLDSHLFPLFHEVDRRAPQVCVPGGSAAVPGMCWV